MATPAPAMREDSPSLETDPKEHRYDRYEQNGEFVLERRYAGDESARSTWTINAADDVHSTLTIDATQSMGAVRSPAEATAARARTDKDSSCSRGHRGFTPRGGRRRRSAPPAG